MENGTIVVDGLTAATVWMTLPAPFPLPDPLPPDPITPVEPRPLPPIPTPTDPEPAPPEPDLQRRQVQHPCPSTTLT